MSVSNSFALKLNRAYEHLDAFQHEVKTWLDTEPYTIIDEPDPETPPQPVPDGYLPRRFRITKAGSVPDRLSIIAGDCLFNLRASLDHLALSLAKTATANINSTQIANSEFPIFSNALTARDESRKIGGITPPASAIIKGLQPYHRGSAYTTHPLWQLHELNRIDKHRELTILSALSMKQGKECVGLRADSFENVSGYAYFISSGDFTLKADAIFVRWAALLIDPNQDVNMNPRIPVEVVFDDAGPAHRQSVIPTLQSICDFVRDSVIAQLAKFL